MIEKNPGLEPRDMAEPRLIYINSAPTEPIKLDPEYLKLSSKNKLMGVALSVTIALGSFVAGQCVSPVVLHESVGCLAPSGKDLAEVTKLFDNATNGNDNNILKDIGSTSTQIANYDESILKKYQIRLGVVSDSQILPGKGLDSPDFSIYLKDAEELSEQYGVDIEVATPKSAADLWLGQAPSVKMLESDNAKQTVLTIREALSELPIDYVHTVGLKHIILADLSVKPSESNLMSDNASAYAITSGNHDTLVFGVNGTIATDTFTHEFGHLVDASQCGSGQAATNDPSYTMLNGKTKYFKDVIKENATYSFSEFDKFIQQSYLSSDQLDAVFNSSYSLGDDKKCNVALAWARREGQQTPVDSDYAYTDVLEDKAQIFRDILGSRLSVALDPITPRVRAKTLLLLARMYAQDPSFVEYLAASPIYLMSPEGLNCEGFGP